MPSPVGHALAGLIVSWTADIAGGSGRPASHVAPARPAWLETIGGPLAIASALFAAAPDADLLFGAHRTFAHSVTAVAIVFVGAWLLAKRWGREPTRVATVLAAAWASHLLTDWLGADPSFPYGIQMLWPFSQHWFISGWDIFPNTERRAVFSLPSIIINLKAIAQEVLILGPPAALVWWIRNR